MQIYRLSEKWFRPITDEGCWRLLTNYQNLIVWIFKLPSAMKQESASFSKRIYYWITVIFSVGIYLNIYIWSNREKVFQANTLSFLAMVHGRSETRDWSTQFEITWKTWIARNHDVVQARILRALASHVGIPFTVSRTIRSSTGQIEFEI